MADMELKNCPFCGGEAELDIDTDADLYRYENVTCADKKCIGTQVFVSPKEWNTRTTDSTIEAQEAEIKRLRDEIEELKIENQNLELAVDMNMNLNIKKVELAIKNCEGKTAQAALAEKGE